MRAASGPTPQTRCGPLADQPTEGKAMHTCEYCTQEATVDWNTDDGLTQVCDAHGSMIDAVVCGLPWNAGKASNADTAPAAGAVMEAAETSEMGAFFDKLRQAIADLPNDASGLEEDGLDG